MQCTLPSCPHYIIWQSHDNLQHSNNETKTKCCQVGVPQTADSQVKGVTMEQERLLVSNLSNVRTPLRTCYLLTWVWDYIHMLLLALFHALAAKVQPGTERGRGWYRKGAQKWTMYAGGGRAGKKVMVRYNFKRMPTIMIRKAMLNLDPLRLALQTASPFQPSGITLHK